MADGQSTHPGATRARVAELTEQLAVAASHEARSRLARRDAAAFAARLERSLPDALDPLIRLYGAEHDVPALARRLVSTLLDAVGSRSDELLELDHRREIGPDWFLDQSMVGYVCYVDRFAGTLAGVRGRLDYLRELGVTYLHLMPLLASRDGPDDGGYAVTDYRAVDPRLGTMADLEELATALRNSRISLCLDVVVNHTASEHAWARRAAEGDETYRAYYRTFDSRALPDAYEASLPEVFPDTAPGNFTYAEELDAWVWTTFHDYQWDLDYSNPDVFAAMLAEMLHLANRGVEVLRLDAVPFTWKRLGTDCQNQPEAHWLLQAWRALVRIAAPAVIFKAEAIVPPGQLVQYLGAHVRQRAECELAYHNQLMVMGWSAVAARDVRLPTRALERMRPPPPGTGWVTYVRCHDDIGWAVDDADAAAVGLDGFAHRGFLNAFYAGEHPGSFARGERFQDDPATGDARISGTAAALAGITQALEAGDDTLLDQAIRRLLVLYAVCFGWGGLPLIYMGDELALGNEQSWRTDPAACGDNRWLHRPWMDWQAAARRHDVDAVEGRVHAGFRHLAAARRRTPALHGAARTRPLWTDDTGVLAWRRDHPRVGPMLGLANVADEDRSVDAGVLADVSLPAAVDALDGDAPVDVTGGRIPVARLSARWLVEG